MENELDENKIAEQLQKNSDLLIRIDNSLSIAILDNNKIINIQNVCGKLRSIDSLIEQELLEKASTLIKLLFDTVFNALYVNKISDNVLQNNMQVYELILTKENSQKIDSLYGDDFFLKHYCNTFKNENSLSVLRISYILVERFADVYFEEIKYK